jgi:hypothetical protein
MMNYLHFENFHYSAYNLDPLFVSNIFIKKIACYSLMNSVLIHVLIEQTRYFSTFDVNKIQVLSRQQGTSRLRTSSDLCTFSINIQSSLRIHFTLLNPIELHSYRVTCIVLFLRIRF